MRCWRDGGKREGGESKGWRRNIQVLLKRENKLLEITREKVEGWCSWRIVRL